MSAPTQPQAFGGPSGPSSAPLSAMNIVQRLTTVNEQTWLSMGNVYFISQHIATFWQSSDKLFDRNTRRVNE
jgi:hypothetical protein